MAELTAFNYCTGNSWLHRLDIRFKLVIIFFYNTISIQAKIPELLILSLPVLISLIQVKIPIRKALYETRFFLYLLMFIFLSRSLVYDASSRIYFNYSLVDMQESLVVCWRLFLILLVGLIFMYSSKMLEIKAAIQWFLKPIPFVAEKKIGLMIGLMIRFVPDILQQASDIKDAQKSRSVENRRNLVYRLTVFSVPLFQGIFSQADAIVDAMLSRCYSEDRSDLSLKSDYLDWIVLVMSVSYLSTSIVINSILVVP